MKPKSLTIIAGGSKGLGAAIVNTFSQAEHEIIELSRSGSSDNHIDCDFANVEQAQAVFTNIFNKISKEPYAHINLIINTAVLAPFGSLQATDAQSIQVHININIHSPLQLLHAFIQSLQNHKAKKTVAYISSGAARRDIPGLAMYSASKAFFERLIDTTATEQNSCSYPITCMTINPGVMNTGMQTEIRAQSKEDFPMVEMWQEWHEKGQLAAPNDIAAVCFDLITNSGKNGGYYTAQN